MNNRYYLRGFVASFISFALQFFIIKIAQFYCNEIQLSLLFSIFTLGFASGTVLVLFDSKKRDLDFRWVAVALLIFLFSLHFSTGRVLFYATVFLLFLPLGHLVGSGISKASAAKFYFSDLFGGATGVLYGFLAIDLVSIETSLILFALAASLLSVADSFITASRRIVNVTLFLLCVLLFGVQVQRDVFNLLRWSKDIPEPSVNSDETFINAFKFLQSGQGKLLHSRWTLLDRIDIMKSSSMEVTAYANNKLWTGVAGKNPIDYFPFLSTGGQFKSVLAIGFGGGEEFGTAKRLGASRIVGVEVNKPLVDLLTNELRQTTYPAFAGVDIVTADARFYLMSTNQEFDLIINRFTDHRGKSARYLTHYNLLRTYDSIELMLTRLSDRGLAVWTVNGDGIFRDPTVSNIFIAVQKFLAQKKDFELDRHFAVFVGDMGDRKSPHGRDYYIVFSAQPLTDDLLKYFFNNSFELVYPPAKEAYPVSVLIDGLAKVRNRAELNEYLDEKFHGDYSSLSDDKPIGRDNTSIYIIFGNIALCVLATLVLFGIAIKKRVSLNDGTVGRMAIALTTGFTYGLLEAALIQEIEYHTPAVAIGYGIVLCMFLVSGGVASLLSFRWSARVCYFAYLAAPLVSVLWISKNILVALPWFVTGLALFVYFVSISLLFPRLLGAQKEESPNNLPFLLSVNLVGLTMGAFVFSMYFLRFSRTEILFLILTITLAAPIIIFRLLRASPIA